MRASISLEQALQDVCFTEHIKKVLSLGENNGWTAKQIMDQLNWDLGKIELEVQVKNTQARDAFAREALNLKEDDILSQSDYFRAHSPFK